MRLRSTVAPTMTCRLFYDGLRQTLASTTSTTSAVEFHFIVCAVCFEAIPS